MKGITASALAACLAFAKPALSVECTHDLAVQGISVLEATGPEAGFPTLPTEVADLGPSAGVPYIETLTIGGLDLMTRNTTAALHWTDGLRLSLAGQCGEPLSLQDRTRAQALIDGFSPWISAWQTALPAERARRSTDKSAAVSLCQTSAALSAAEASMKHEKDNPSGVVDMELLHSLGQQVQMLRQLVATRNRFFMRDRKKAFSVTMCAKWPP